MFELIKPEGCGVICKITDYMRGFNFPEQIGDLKLKDDFHLTLMFDLLNHPDLPDKLQRISDEIAPLLEANPPKLTGEFRRVVEGKAETIVAPVVCPVVDQWQKRVSEILPHIQFDFLHVTLYRNNHAGFGIPIHSAEKYAQLTRDLEPEVERVLREKWEMSK